MKSAEKQQSFQQSEEFESVGYRVEKEDMAKMLRALRDTTYTDKAGAVLREYYANVQDAHSMVGKEDQPGIVTLPTRTDPTLKIRDFGPGLSPNDITNVYSCFGKSTKENDNKMIGEKGIGAKCGHAYGDNFLILSYQNGTLTTYNSYLDQSDEGRIAKMGVSDTDEPDGIEIHVPVLEEDIPEFLQKAARIYQYFTPRPIIKGQEIEYPDREVLVEGKDWKLLDSGTPIAVMGNIGYPLDRHAITWTDDERDLLALLSQGMEIHFENGLLETAINREGLQYTRGTVANIKTKMKAVLAELMDQLAKDFENCDSMFAAKILYGKLYNIHSPLYRLRSLLQVKKIKFGNHEIGSDYFGFHGDNIGATLKAYLKQDDHWNRGSIRMKKKDTERFNCDEAIPVYEVDITGGISNRIAPIIDLPAESEHNSLNKQHKVVYAITVTDQGLWDAWKKKVGFDVPMNKLSDLPKVKLADIYGSTASGGGGYDKNVKHSQKVLALDLDTQLQSYRQKSRSGFFKSVEVDVKKDEGVYVVIDRFKVQTKWGDEDPTETINQVNEFVKGMGLEPQTIFAVKIGKVDSLGKGFVPLLEWMKNQVETCVKDNKLEQAYLDIKHSKDLRESEFLHRILECAEVASYELPDDIKNFESHKTAMLHIDVADKVQQVMHYEGGFGVKVETKDLTPTHDLETASNAIKIKYKLLAALGKGRLFESYHWRDRDKSMDVALLEYVTMADMMEPTA